MMLAKKGLIQSVIMEKTKNMFMFV